MVLRSEILVNKNVMPTAEQALPGRESPMQLPEFHYVFEGTPLLGPFFEGHRLRHLRPGLLLGRRAPLLAA
jgi:hypothetical protein